MASKKDLVEGQAFSRRRLITAFVSGAPGGREVEPGKPLRAVVGGVVLSAILLVGALAAGLLAPTLPDGWDKGSLVIAKDTGARYVALDGTLYPVLNTASARLLIPSGFKVVSADADKIVGAPRGKTLGIPGAPDALPSPSALITTWNACTSQGGGLTTTISRSAVSTPVTDRAIAVTVATSNGNDHFLIDNGIRYSVDPTLIDPVKRALKLDTAPDYTVTADFVNLFPEGPAIAQFDVPQAGTSLAGVKGLPAGAVVGSIVNDANSADRPYLLLAGGSIAPLPPFAEAVYRIRTDAAAADNIELASPVFAQLGVASTQDPVWPQAWPTQIPGALNGTPCALMKTGGSGTKPSVSLASSPMQVEDGRVKSVVDAGGGSLVRAIGAASLSNGPVFLVDQTGVKFPIEGTSNDDPVVKLGYADNAIAPVPQAFVNLLGTGPTLSTLGARAEDASAGGK